MRLFFPLIVVMALAPALLAAQPIVDDFSADPFAGDAELVGPAWRGGGVEKRRFIHYDAEQGEIDFIDGRVHVVRTDAHIGNGKTASATIRIDRENNYSKVALFLTADAASDDALHEHKNIAYLALSNSGGTEAAHGALVAAVRIGGATVHLRNFVSAFDLKDGEEYTLSIARQGYSLIFAVKAGDRSVGSLTLHVPELADGKVFAGVGTFGSVRASLTRFEIAPARRE